MLDLERVEVGIAKSIPLKQGLWLKPHLASQPLCTYCKEYSTKTRIVTDFHIGWVLPVLIAKSIPLKQGLWLIWASITNSLFYIAKSIPLKQGLWLFSFIFLFLGILIAKSIPLKQGLWRYFCSVFFSLLSHCKEYSTKTRIVTWLKTPHSVQIYLLQRVFH